MDTLKCMATGTGPILYKWEKYQPSDDSWIRPSSRVVDNLKVPKLTFNVIIEEDEGIYRCVVSNYDGSVITYNATITVYGMLSFLKRIQYYFFFISSAKCHLRMHKICCIQSSRGWQ